MGAKKTPDAGKTSGAQGRVGVRQRQANKSDPVRGSLCFCFVISLPSLSKNSRHVGN
jgi:hypothetical protein